MFLPGDFPAEQHWLDYAVVLNVPIAQVSELSWCIPWLTDFYNSRLMYRWFQSMYQHVNDHLGKGCLLWGSIFQKPETEDWVASGLLGIYIPSDLALPVS